ncbi:hypothetical protein CH375_19240, partial [Leptospira ellisii]
PLLFILMLVAGAFAVATGFFFLISYAFGKLQKEEIQKKYQIGPDSAKAPATSIRIKRSGR